jgi:hypothetical protein
MLALLVVLSSGMARAQQSVSANILGTVTDQLGAVIPGAQITVKNIGTGITNTAKSDDKGEYLVQYLQIGNYEVVVEAKGFKKFLAKDISLTAGDHARVDAKMTLGGTNETVTVSAIAAPALQTDTSTIGSEIPSTNIQDVPLSGRNLTDLVLMTAGVQTTVSDSKLNNGCQATPQNGYRSAGDDCRMGSGYAVNGESDLNQNNQLDGMDNNDRNIGEIEVKPSIDAIEEVKVQTSLYSADTGRTSGGVVQIVTKSGSNTFKGSIYEYLRNDAFDAWTTWALNKPTLRQNQFGGTIGGPIIKNKTFFFADYEGLRISQSTPPNGSGTQMPDQPLLTAVASGNITDINTALAADGLGQLPSGATVDPVAKNIMALFPSGKYNTCTTLGSASTCYYKGNTPRSQTANTADIRIDQHINDKNTLYGRYSYNLTETTNGGTFPSTTVNGGVFSVGSTYANQPEDNLSLDYTHIFRANLILDLKAGYTYSKNFNTPNDPLNDETALGFYCGAGVPCPENTAGTLARSGLPSISCIGPASSGGGGMGPPGGGGTPCSTSGAWSGIGEGQWIPILIRNHVHQYNASLTWTKGTENLKFGASLIDRQLIGGQEQSVFGSISFMDGSVCPDINGGNAISTSTAAFLLGCAASKSRGFLAVSQHLRTYEPSAYVQDDWRVFPKLTLNLGVRYDLYTPYADEDGYISNFDPETAYTYNGTTYTGVLVSPDLLGAQHSDKYGNVPIDYSDIQPRFGFAYSLPQKGFLQNMVLRGGFGTSYYPGTLGPNSRAVNAPFTYSLSCAVSYAGSTTTVYGTAGTMCAGVDDTLDGGFPIPNTGSSSVVLTATDPALYSSEGGGGFVSTDTHLKPSAMYQYSMQMQKDWRSNIITVGYVGTLGRHLADKQSENTPVDSGAYFPWNGANTAGPNYVNPLTSKSMPFGYPFADLNNYTCILAGGATGACPNNNPNTANLTAISSAALTEIVSPSISEYNALQATFLRRAASGLTTSINYTYAHQLANGTLINEGGGMDPVCTNYGCRVDNGSGSAATAKLVGQGQYSWGNSLLDMRHRLTGVVTYQLPFARNTHGIVHGVAAGWTANVMGTLQTGLHYTVTAGGGPGGGGGGGPAVGGTSCVSVSDPNYSHNPSWCPTTWSGVSSEQSPNMVPGCDVKKTPAGVSKLDEAFNLSCFTLQQFGTYGNERLNQLAAPGMERADISMIKEFDLHENYKLQFRAESFNITNHPSYGTPSSGLSDSTYGASNAAQLFTAAGTESGGLPLLPTIVSCEASRTGQSGGGGPGGGPIACITNTQGLNREFQFALRLTF